MKRLCFIAFLMLILFAQNTNAQWIRLNAAVETGTFGKVQVVTPDVIYIADRYSHQLYKSADSGTTWNYTPGIFSEGYPNSIYFTSEDTGYIACDKGWLYKTTDGGRSYTTISRPYQHYKDIRFVNETTGFIVGNGRTTGQPADSAFVLKTTDAGATWSYYSLGHTWQMTSVSFSDAMTGCAVGANGMIHVTTDGGATWTLKTSGISDQLLDVFCVSPTVFYAGGYSDAFIQTVNGGDTWTHVTTGQTGFPYYNGMYFIDSANAYVAYSSGLLSKNNSTWSRLSSVNTTLNDVHFLNSTTGYAVGNDARIYKYVGNTPLVFLGNPASGARINSGQDYSITWSANAVDTLMIEYRTGPSQPWQTIAAKVAALQGQYFWSVPAIETTTAAIRIISITNNTVTSISPDNLIITLEKSIMITSPDKYSSTLVSGKKIGIRWTSLNIDTVKIEYRTTSAGSWNLIAGNVKASLGSYLYTLPVTPATDFQVKVSWVKDGYYADSTKNGNIRERFLNTENPIWSLQNPKPFAGSVKDAQVVGTNIIYALADPNLFIRSTDNGVTWTIIKQMPLDGETFKSLSFINTMTGYILAGNNYGSVLYKTTDAGITWITVNEGLPGTAAKVSFANVDSGWISGGDYASSLVMYTANGGVLFTDQNSQATKLIKDLFVVNALKAWLVSEDGSLRGTVNAGASWDSSAQINYSLNDIHFIGNNGWAGGGDWNNRKLLVTTDNGLTWTVKSLSGGAIEGIAMKDVTTGYAISSSGSSSDFFQKTTDGGNTWNNISAYVSANSSYMPFADRILIASNDEGVGFKSASYNTDPAFAFSVSGTVVTAWSSVSSEVFKSSGISNYQLNGISMIDSLNGYVLGKYLLRTNDGGTNWNIASTTDFFTNSLAVHFIAKDTGFACASKNSDNGIYRTVDGGNSWTFIRSTGSTSPFRIQFTDRNTGFVLSNNSFDSIYKTNDGGNSWNSIARPSGTNQGICFLDANKGFVFGTSLAMTLNGGTTWSSINLNMDAGAYLTKMKFIDAAIGYAVGYYGTLPGGGLCAYIFKTTDGGTTWTRQICPSFGGNTLRDVHFIDADNGFASGEGMMYQTTDGGSTWKISALPIPNGSTSHSISGLTFTDNKNGWAIVGNNNNIIMKCNFKAPVTEPPVPSIILTAPNGSETWIAGTQQNITWTSANIDSVKIAYRSAPSGAWQTIATVAAGNTSYSWTVPNVPASVAKVRVSSSSNVSIADSSDAPFSIIAPVDPVVTLTAPNGGEIWTAGTQQDITWTSANIDSVKIEYRTAPSGAWQTIATLAAVDAAYSWMIPGTPTSTGMVRIISSGSTTVSDSSDASFTIITTSSPVITLTAPNGNEIWNTGSHQNVTWTSSGIDSVTIFFSTGGSYTEITTLVASAGTFDWLVPNTPSLTCKVMITDPSNTIKDSSDAVFEIQQSVGLNEAVAYSGLSIYPNPFSNNLNIAIELQNDAEIDVVVSDLTGKIVLSEKHAGTLGRQLLEIHQDLPEGMYIASVSVNGTGKSYKLIRTK